MKIREMCPVSLAGTALLLTGFSAWAQPHETAKFDNDHAKFSHAMGVQTAKQYQRREINLDPHYFIIGFNESYQSTNNQSQSSGGTMPEATTEDLVKRGQARLLENTKNPEIITLPSGLQYRVITEGNGNSPKATDQVLVNYEGRLVDGQIFDSSYQRGQPAQFPVNGVIPGFSEALQLMKPGAKWEVFIPSELAYGARGAGGLIGPNQMLIFTLELIEVK